MDIDRILCELEQNRGYFPREAVEEAIRQRATITPHLLRAIKEATEHTRESFPNAACGSVSRACGARRFRRLCSICTKGRSERSLPMRQWKEVQEVLRGRVVPVSPALSRRILAPRRVRMRHGASAIGPYSGPVRQTPREVGRRHSQHPGHSGGWRNRLGSVGNASQCKWST